MRPAFLVDGITEQRFIQLICAGRPVKLINLNGNSVKTAALAKRVASLIRIWKGRYYPIVVIVDREDREEPFDAFAESLLEKIRDEAVNDQLIIGVADRMIENWMVADPDLWVEQTLPDCVDGCSGATVLRRYLKTYDKAANGPQLLQRSRASEIKKLSPSFRALADKLGAFRCAWLSR